MFNLFRNRQPSQSNQKSNRRQPNSLSRKNGRQLETESLERREVMAASISGGHIVIIGSESADNVAVQYKSGYVHVVENERTTLVANAKQVKQIAFHGNGGDDRFDGSSIGVPIWAWGGEGNDTLIGGSAADLLYGMAGRDTLRGGSGNDILHGDDALDLFGPQVSGADLLFGDAGDDTIYGGGDDDTIYGGAGNDFLYGGYGGHPDFFFFPSGNDSIFGGSGSDILFGQDGNDVLDGGAGVDKLYGDYPSLTSGRDTFHQYWLLGAAEDSIYDYRQAEDGDSIVNHSAILEKVRFRG